LFEDVSDLAADLIERVLDGRIGVTSLKLCLQLTQLLLQLAYIGVDLVAVIPSASLREQALSDPREVLAHLVKPKGCDARMES
jgi:hypothetical protein